MMCPFCGGGFGYMAPWGFVGLIWMVVWIVLIVAVIYAIIKFINSPVNSGYPRYYRGRDEEIQELKDEIKKLRDEIKRNHQ
ncbi:MAG: stage III sporulation protein AF [Desulfurococcales archaeon]|nr:stage III sporulation protein AF [Desulfurococcales archaeon]